jgi:hypothetical protein
MAHPHKIDAAPPKARGPRVEVKALPITAFARAHGVSTVTVWRALRDGRLRAIRVGKVRLVLLDSVEPA